MSTVDPDQHYRIDPHARFRVLDGEGIFVLQKAGEVLVVNPLGAFIVERLQAHQSLNEVVTAVAEQYTVNRTRARADADTLIATLLEAGAMAPS